MEEISLVLRDEQQLQLNHIIQETDLERDFIINSAINEYYTNYLAWKRRLSLELKEGDKENPKP